MFKKLAEAIKRKPSIGWLIFAVTMVGVFVLGLLAASITERRAEIATIVANRIENIAPNEPRSELYKNNFSREYNTWKKTQEMDFRSKYNGNAMQDVLESRPEMVVLWAGYAFSKDYSAPRGHMHALEDNRNTLRTGTPEKEGDGPQPAACWVCKSPDVPRIMREQGIEGFYQHQWGDLGSQIVNPIGCATCHDSETMNLSISQPALIQAFEARGKKIEDATPQEMRSLVCAQCHVEYYFAGPEKVVTFPWKEGMTVEDMEHYYDEIEFSDWTHSLSKAPMLKAQHPDYEVFLMGTHAQRGLSCADCHMPYKADGPIKFSDHQIMSPLKNVANTCQVCHRDTEENLIKYVYDIQDKANEIRNRVEAELSKAHILAKTAWDNGATDVEMKKTLQLLRQAQWRWDFSVATHGGSFHAPIEIQRILAHSLDRTMQAQLEVQKVLFAHGVTDVNMPDISTKAKAQKYIGLDMKKEVEAKEKWINTVVPKWLDEAEKAGRLVAAK